MKTNQSQDEIRTHQQGSFTKKNQSYSENSFDDFSSDLNGILKLKKNQKLNKIDFFTSFSIVFH